MKGTIEPYADDFPGQTRGPSKKPDGNWDLGDMPEEGDVCTADAVSAGEQVTVTDENNKVVGVGEWSVGTYQNDETASFCRFTYSIADVPEGSKFYGVKFGENDVIQLSRAEAEDQTYSVGGSAHGEL